MAKKKPPKETQPAAFDFDINYMEEGRHSAILLLPKAYHAPIGLVVAHWGNFEAHFDICLHGLVEGALRDDFDIDTIDWRGRRFKQRKKLFKSICADWLSTWEPDNAEKLIDQADQSGDLYWKRNMIAHGTYAYSMPPHSQIATNFRAISAPKEKEFPFDEHVLKKLYHDISHLTAELVLTFQSFGQIEGPFFSLPDKEILRVYAETNHPWNPNPDKRTPQPPTSQE